MFRLSLLALGLLACGALYGATDLSLKNYREIFDSFAVATNGTPTAAVTAYEQMKSTFPKYGNVDEYNSAMALNVSRLAGYFCQAMIASDAAKKSEDRWAHKAVDFSVTPDKVTVEVQKDVISTYGTLFWQAPPSPAQSQIMLDFVANVTPDLPATAAGTKQLLLLTCTAMASTIDFLKI